jgi:hypothetical protein
MPEINPHTYKIMTVPPGCTKYQLGQQIELNVEEPAPLQIQLVDESPPCNETIAVLDE